MANPFAAMRIDMEGRVAPSKPTQANVSRWIASRNGAPPSRPKPQGRGPRSVAGIAVPGAPCLWVCRPCQKASPRLRDPLDPFGPGGKRRLAQWPVSRHLPEPAAVRGGSICRWRKGRAHGQLSPLRQDDKTQCRADCHGSEKRLERIKKFPNREAYAFEELVATVNGFIGGVGEAHSEIYRPIIWGSAPLPPSGSAPLRRHQLEKCGQSAL